MGHFFFILLHLLAVFLFGGSLLLLTIPFHLIYTVAVSGRAAAPASPSADVPSVLTHVRCPECRELVRMDAIKCKHCGCGLTAQAIGMPERAYDGVEWKPILITGAIVLVLAVFLGFFK